MAMDKTIDPKNSSLHGDLTIQNGDVTTIKGKFWLDMNLFKSDNSKRDDNMYKDVKTDKFKLASYTVSNITKNDNDYTMHGKLSFYGQERDLSAKAKINLKDGAVVLDATSSFKPSDFGLKMPCMVFMCVRDQIDLVIKAELK
jgi:polyisoprenoid-binding protein YceI